MMQPRMILIVVFLACCTVFSVNANASCNSSGKTRLPLDSPKAYFLQMGLLQLSSQNNGEHNDDDAIVGLWHIRFLSGGQLFDEGFDQFHSDGTEILNDNAPPAPANGTGNICLGVFKSTGRRTYKLRHPFWSFDGSGNLAGTGVILEQITVAEDGNTFNGSFSLLTYDLSGAVTSETTGELKAERITPD